MSVELRLSFPKQQEMRYMWNSDHAWDGGAFYRKFGRFTCTFMKSVRLE